jgi:hypothetical protein
MSSHQNYQSLVDRYKKDAQFVKKLGTFGMIVQVAIFGFVSGWEHLKIGHYEIAAPILFSLSLYFLVKDFLTSRRIEGNIAQMILDGVELEKRNPTVGKFFHGLLQSFNFTRVLLERSLINVLALCCLSYLIFRFVGDVIFPGVTIGRWSLGLCIWIPSVVACKLYHDSLKVLDEAKEKIFAK